MPSKTNPQRSTQNFAVIKSTIMRIEKNCIGRKREDKSMEAPKEYHSLC